MARAPTPKRYGQAAFQLALKAGRLEAWLEDLQTVEQVLQDETLRGYLELPRVHLDRKVEIIRRALVEADPLVQNLACLLASRLSLGMVPAIVQEYGRLLDAHHGRARVRVVTAVPLAERLERQVNEQIRELVGMTIVLSTLVDPNVVGGLVVRVGDRVIDGSTRRVLEDMKQALSQEMPA